MLKNIKILLIILVLFQNICQANPVWMEVVEKDAQGAQLDENRRFVFLADSRLENTPLINEIVEKAMDRNNRIYIECYIDFWMYGRFRASRIPYKFLLNGEVDIYKVLNYEAYKNNLADIKNIYVKHMSLGVRFYDEAYLYVFKSFLNEVLYTIYITLDKREDMIGNAIVIMKYNKNVLAAQERFSYDENFKNTLKEMVFVQTIAMGRGK